MGINSNILCFFRKKIARRKKNIDKIFDCIWRQILLINISLLYVFCSLILLLLLPTLVLFSLSFVFFLFLSVFYHSFFYIYYHFLEHSTFFWSRCQSTKVRWDLDFFGLVHSFVCSCKTRKKLPHSIFQQIFSFYLRARVKTGLRMFFWQARNCD